MQTDNVVDMEVKLSHEVCEVMCCGCHKRWIAAFPESTLLKQLECPGCGEQGFVFKTGQTIREEENAAD